MHYNFPVVRVMDSLRAWPRTGKFWAQGAS